MNTQYDPATDPVLCSPYHAPDRHWQLDELGRADKNKAPASGRRVPLAISVPDDVKGQGQTALKLKDRVSNKNVLDIRAEVAKWRADDYRGATDMSRRLLLHWASNDPHLRPFFAQVEAIETFIWLREVATRANLQRRRLEEQSRRYNDEIVRLCAKMATGTGKTAVMGMVIAWQTLNAARSRRKKDLMHTDRFAVIAPGHTVRERLGVLVPSANGNVYDEMGLVPNELRELLNRAKVRIVNFQAFRQRELISDTQAKKLLGKAKGEETEDWSAAVRRVLGDIAKGRGTICLINDEAHHCYTTNLKTTGQEAERAEIWFNAMKAMREMGLLGKVTGEHGQENPVYDFSATPLWINTASKSEPEQFQWVSSDFGLMEAIESGLVKVPRVPIDDDGNRDETVWRKLYNNTASKDLESWLKGKKNASGLPEALNGALKAVVGDWEKRLEQWQPSQNDSLSLSLSLSRQPTPPVIIFVVNSIKNAKALWRYLAGGENEDGTLSRGNFSELSNVDPHGNWYPEPRTLLVHSKVNDGDTVPTVFKKALVAAAGLGSQVDAEEAVRKMLNTVGKPGEPGAQVRCVVSVAMLTEGWDARTVTHIVGFRAFSTQLLCEQVTGRALRRTSYEALREPDEKGRRLFEAEYADVVGIPFEFMPSVEGPIGPPSPPKPRTRVHAVEGRRHLRVSWPNVIEYVRRAPEARFHLAVEKVEAWRQPAAFNPTRVVVSGIAGRQAIIGNDEMARDRTRLLSLASLVAEYFSAPDGKAEGLGRVSLFRCAHQAVEEWAEHPKVEVGNLERLLGDSSIARAAANAVVKACVVGSPIAPSLSAGLGQPAILDTSAVDFETRLQHIMEPTKSELSHAACHSRLELKTAEALDDHSEVVRWVRNHNLGSRDGYRHPDWTIPYWRNGLWVRYEPDFVAVLKSGVNLVIECKGIMDNKAERAAEYAREHWVPSLAATSELPKELRIWHYGMIDNPDAVRYQLDLAINEANEQQRTHDNN